MRLASWVCLLATLACSRERASPPPPPPHAPAKQPAQVHRLQVLRGEQVALDRAFTLAAGTSSTLAVDDGVHIELRGPGQFMIGGEQVLVGEGVASIDVAPQALRSGSAFSLATPAGRVEIPFAARLVLRAHGTAELAVVSGEALADGTLPVGAQTRVCLGAVGPHALRAAGFATVEAALEALPGSDVCARDQPPSLAKLEQDLATQLDAFAQNQAEQGALLARVRAHAADEAGRRLVQDLALRGQRALASRTRVLSLRSQLAAAQLGVASDPARADLLARASQLAEATR